MEPRLSDPIELPDGRRLATLKDAAEYVTNLPTSEQRKKAVKKYKLVR